MQNIFRTLKTLKSTMTEASQTLRLTNVEDGELIHQRCLLITGICQPAGSSSEDFISVKTIGANEVEIFPEQTWPVYSGHFKALVMLSPGSNSIEMTHTKQDGQGASLTITLQYIPLLQYPPLHLAIMVAKDSPLLMDCPSQKAPAHLSAHSDLAAAIEKFRMTAYMWQAMTAEDFRVKGLGRRTFRLEEEWTADTVSREFINAQHSEHYACNSGGVVRSTAKITIVKSSKTKRDILNGDSSFSGSDNVLFKYFMEALADHGGQFDTSSSPVVAGLIFDAHYNKATEQTFGHISTGRHNASGISLGTFGSHLTYSWPRFTEEVNSCLTDSRPGTKISGRNSTIWESCAFGQSSFLSAVGLAFGNNRESHEHGDECTKTKDWRKRFLPCKEALAGSSEDAVMSDCAAFELQDALNLRLSKHFLLPTDKCFTEEQRQAEPVAEPKFTENERGELDAILHIASDVGIARISFNEVPEATPSINDPTIVCDYSEGELESRFERSKPLRLEVLGYNGRELIIENVWRMLAVKTFVRIPGSSIRLFKRSVYTSGIESVEESETCEWAQLLKERGADGNIHRAISIDLRVGCWWDGGVVKYADGHKSHWGPMRTGGREHRFGGHASQTITLPPDVQIKRIEVNRGHTQHYMQGVRMRLADRTVRGELNARHGDNANVIRLEPASHEVIVGFYGRSAKHDGVMEFGIITVAKDIGLDGLPDAVYDLPELKNTVGLGENDHNADDDDHNNSENQDDEDEDGDEDDDDDDVTVDGDGNYA
ncbi:hypothetical protein E8E13_009049 [Curvularia kusanoi]|uniref:Jacalin-type lectin domain-containing protein n=1 Tax=Curvularia kusanoi TaxID=90978 RepID=A0A9P4WB66_CURKU|nr:hypothetical protein E8E13_009049 [Curvularia kusanoi]